MQEHFDVVAVQLPGREQRFIDPPFTSVEQAIDELLPSLTASLSGAGAITIFGHSMGAMLAFELARRLHGRPGFDNCSLVVSGSPPPGQPRTQEATGLDDDAFIAQVERFSGYSHEALEDPEMRELLLPLLRADVEMHERYRPKNVTPLPVPITCVRAEQDQLVTVAESHAWQNVTSMPLEYVEVAGGHMYLADDPSELISLLVRSAALAVI